MHNGLDEPTVDHWESPVGWFWPVVGLAVYISFPYYFSLETFFSHDDFAILWFHKDWSIWKPWRFLDVEVLTFYRPLQSYLFAVLYHFFGMTPFPYCLVLVLIHLANVVLFGRMVDRLFEDRSLTLLSVIFFAANWEYCTVVYWKGNYGTALSWLFVLGAANTFLDYLRRRRRRLYVATFVLLVAALLSKETAVNAPLLLSLLYGMYALGSRDGKREETGAAVAAARRGVQRMDWRAHLLEAAGLLGPCYLLVGAFGCFHLEVVQDVYDWLPKGYEITKDPLLWIHSIARAFTVWMAWWLEAGIEILYMPPKYPGWMVWLHRRPYLLPVVLFLIATVLRDRRLFFGLIWSVLAFLPANLIEDPHAARYYYGSIMGVSLIYAGVILAVDRAIVRRGSFGVIASARVIGSLLVLGFVLTSLFNTTSIVGSDARKCRQIEDVYHFLARHRGDYPSNTLFRVRCLNALDHFHYGMGLREMFKLALQDDGVEAILPDQHLTDKTLAILTHDYPPAIDLIRFSSGRFEFRELKPTSRTRTRAQEP